MLVDVVSQNILDKYCTDRLISDGNIRLALIYEFVCIIDKHISTERYESKYMEFELRKSNEFC